MGIGILAAGATVGISSVLAWMMLAVLGIFLRKEILAWWRSWRDLYTLWQESDRFGRTVASGIILISGFTLATALAPPLKFDALVYHLSLPQAYLEANRIIYTPQLMFWGMPQMGEMLYTWAVALSGNETAAVLGWICGLLSLIGLAGYVSTRLGTRSAWVSVAALCSGFSLAASLAWAYVDWLVILFGWAFLVVMDCWRQEGKGQHLAVAGAFVGLALGTKYTAGVLLLAGMVSVIVQARSRVGTYGVARALLHFSFWAVLFSLPWWVKNTLATGNPFYPFIFPAGAMNPLRMDLYQNHIPWGSWQDVLLLPWRATVQGMEAAPGYSASIGPLLLALGVLACLYWPALPMNHQSLVSSAAWIALPGLLVWILASRFSEYLIQSRLYFSLFPSLAVLAGAGFTGLVRKSLPGVKLERVAGALILLVFGFNVLEVGVFSLHQGSLELLLGNRSKEAYLSGNLGGFAPAMQAVRELPPESRVLMLWEPRSLYCHPRCFPDEILDRWLNDRYTGSPSNLKHAAGRTAGAILHSWQEAGYTHLLFYRLGADFVRQEDGRYRPSDWQALEDLFTRLPAPETFGPAYSLFKLIP